MVVRERKIFAALCLFVAFGLIISSHASARSCVCGVQGTRHLIIHARADALIDFFVRRHIFLQTSDRASRIIATTIPFWGWYFRLAAKIPLAGKITGLTNKALGKLLPELSFLGFRKEASYEGTLPVGTP